MLPWRIVAGAFLHFALPAYIFVGLACCAAGLLGGLTSSELAARTVPYSAMFAIAYLLLAVVATAAAAMLDPLFRRRRRRQVQRDPGTAERQSRRNLADALAEGRSRLDGGALSALDAIASTGWHHDEPAFQSISADLAAVVRTSAAALATAPAAQRRELAAVTTAALTSISTRLHELRDERGRLDEGDLRTVARYIDGRYPPSDSAGDSIG